MKRALIGHTGFVGGHLKRAGSFTDLYNSSNFRELAGREFDEVVCAGIPAVKWIANREPERDWEVIDALLSTLRNVNARNFTLISTIDVYPDPSIALDERHLPDPDSGEPYGRHRLAVERFVAERCEDHLIVRLPALFGRGLKKNVVFDLLAGNQTERINPKSVFQWYPLARLAGDLGIARNAGLRLVNLFTEPIETSRIVALFPGVPLAPPTLPAPRYQLQTIHGALFGGDERYVASADAVMASLRDFIASARIDPGMIAR